MASSPYLTFVDLPHPGRKTAYVGVNSTSGGYRLGTIKWYGAWRQFCFFPEPRTIFNKGCLDTINAKITELMDERKTPK